MLVKAVKMLVHQLSIQMLLFLVEGLPILDIDQDKKPLLLVVGEQEEMAVEGAELNEVVGEMYGLLCKITRYNEFIQCNLFLHFVYYYIFF